MRQGLSTAELLAGLLALAAFSAPAALAAPFCLELQAVPPECVFFDANACRVEANHQHGACVVNPLEVQLGPSVGAYCIVTSGQATSCTFQDAVSCAREAVHQGGVCVTAPPATAGSAPNASQPRQAPAEDNPNP